jgi:hypothetical protein
MTSKAEELWEKYSETLSMNPGAESVIYKDDFLAALREYGAEVRKRDAGVCLEQWRVSPPYLTTTEVIGAVVAAIVMFIGA